MRAILLFTSLLLAASLAPLPASGQSWCPGQQAHLYVSGGSANLLTGQAQTRAMGGVTVQDTDFEDCDGDGFPGGDGDWETGVGGGYFPRSHHDPTWVCVNDFLWGGSVAFIIAIDGDGDGAIFPDINPQDAVFGPFLGCGGIAEEREGCAHRPVSADPNVQVDGVSWPQPPGADGGPSASGHCPDILERMGVDGFWVYLQAASVVETASGARVSNPATAGTIMTA